MKRIWMLLVAGLAASILLPTVTFADELSGARVYSDNCGRCHLPRAPFEFSDAAWDIVIHHMHVRGYLTEPERVAVLHYLQSSNRRAAFIPPGPPVTGDAAPDGKALVAQFGCQGCHIVDGAGGNIGPVLDTVFARRDAEYIISKLNDPTFDNPRTAMPYLGLSEAHRKAIVDYLRGVQQ